MFELGRGASPTVKHHHEVAGADAKRKEHAPPRALQPVAAPNGVAEARADEQQQLPPPAWVAEASPHHAGKEIFFPVPGCEMSSFQATLQRENAPALRSPAEVGGLAVPGRRVEVNGKELALFYHRKQFYAIEEHCPHLGGPLHLGDIEDAGCSLPPRVVCPWHKWCFDLETGRQVRPLHCHSNIQSYPVRTTPSGQIAVGFEAFNAACFTSEDF